MPVSQSCIYAPSLHAVLHQLRLENEFCDATLVADGGVGFRIHKIVLIASSPHFREVFSSPEVKKQGKDPRVSVPDVSPDLLQQIVDFVYLRRLELSWNNVWDLIMASEKFCIPHLMHSCLQFLDQNIQPSNCLKIDKFARKNHLQELHAKCKRCFLTSLNTHEAEEIGLLNMEVEELVDLLSDSSLNCTEERVWEVILKWVAHDKEDRSTHINDLLRCVRLVFVARDFLFRKIICNDMVTSNELCRSYVLDRFRFLLDLPTITETEMQTPGMAKPRFPHEVMFLIGGCRSGGTLDCLHAYDSKGDVWKQVKAGDRSEHISCHQCVSLGSDIYVIGGYQRNVCLRACRVFNIVKKKWRRVAPLISPRASLCAEAVDGYVFAFGGTDGMNTLASSEKYDSEENEWHSCAEMRAKRVRAASARMDDIIFLAGGCTGHKHLNYLDAYSIKDDRWIPLSPMNQPRSELSMAAYKGCLYAVGGYDGQSVLRTAEKYDVSCDLWTFIPEMFNPRCQFAMEVVNDVLVVVGGQTNHPTEDSEQLCERYLFATRKWRHLSDSGFCVLASGHCVVSNVDGILDEYIFQDRSAILVEKKRVLIEKKKRNKLESYFRTLEMFFT